MISQEAIPSRADIPWRNIDGNVLIVQPAEGHIYPLNSVATRIWLLSDGRRRVDEILHALAEEFDAQPEDIRRDALRFLEELEKAALITTRLPMTQGSPHGI